MPSLPPKRCQCFVSVRMQKVWNSTVYFTIFPWKSSCIMWYWSLKKSVCFLKANSGTFSSVQKKWLNLQLLNGKTKKQTNKIRDRRRLHARYIRLFIRHIKAALWSFFFLSQSLEPNTGPVIYYKIMSLTNT